MYQQPINILSNSDIYNCTSCIHDSKLGYCISWEENNNLNGYGDVGGLTSYTTWGGVYFGVSTSGSCYISQESDLSVDASIYSTIKVDVRLDTGSSVVSPTMGRIQFKTSSESEWSSGKTVDFSINDDTYYHEYSIDMTSNIKWSGNITRFRFYPMIDGPEGTKIHIKSIKIEARSLYACDSAVTGSVCSKYSDYIHPCPWVGSPGYSLSQELSDGITISKGVNDKILVNIDGYGNQAVTLRPVINSSIRDIAFDIQEKLNLIGIGGYSLARCYVDNHRLKIESGWRGSDSSVVVSEPTTSSCCVTLGLFNSAGEKISTELLGSEPASKYETAPVHLNSSDIKYLKSSNHINNKGSFSIDGSVYSPQGGLSSYKNFSRATKLSFKNKTLIDFNNPINSDGIIEFIGFSGDCFTNTEFRIYRQKLDGSFYLVFSIDISEEEDKEDGIFELSNLNIRVKKGDLLSLYSASLHIGNEQKIKNYSYVLYSGDMLSGTAIQEMSGSGEKGLPLFVRGSRKSNEAVIDIEFEKAELIESLFIYAESDSWEEEVNLCTVRNGGLDGGPYVEGTTGYDINGDKAPEILGLSYLIDGQKQDISGEEVYCYPGWLDLTTTEQEDFNYTDFQISFDFAKGINVYFPIYKINMYFVDDKNVKSFRWEIPIATNPEDTDRIWGVGWDRYQKVYTEDGIMDSSGIYLYDNPSVVTSDNYQVSYSHLDYKFLQLILSPFMARSIRFNATLGASPEIDTSQPDYSYFQISPSPKIEEIEIFAKFVAESDLGHNFSVFSSSDDLIFLEHTDYDLLSTEGIKYIVGRPISKLRLKIKTDVNLNVFNVYGVLSEDYIDVDTNYLETMVLNAPINNPDLDVAIMSVTNDSDSSATFFVDVIGESSKSERCLLWNKLDSQDNIKNSEIGSGGIIRRREERYLRPYNYAYGCPGYYLNKNFVAGNPAYISLDNKQSWTSVGSTITDGSVSSYLTNENPLFYIYEYVYVALYLGDSYSVGSITLNGLTGLPGFSSTVLYSSKNTTNPADIPTDPNDPYGWRVDSVYTARWALFMAPSVTVGSESTRYLAYAEVEIDFTKSYNKGKLPWVSAAGLLTNGLSGTTEAEEEEGWISDGVSEYFCVDLGWWHNVTNVITGPMSVAAESIVDVDALLPGAFPSIVDSSCAGEDVSYSASYTNDPADVVWESFGLPPSNPVRWIMVKTDTRIEEIIVQTDDNESNAKQSFLNSGWFTSNVLSLEQDFVGTKTGICSISMDYTAGYSPTEEYILYKHCLGFDEELSKRDVLAFWLYVEDVEQLDSSYGYFRLGTSLTQDNTPLDINLTLDEYNRYEWSLSSLFGYLESGWSYLELPFSDNYKNGVIYLAEDNKERVGVSTYASTRDRIAYIKFVFRGVENNSKFSVKLDDFRIVRRHFTSGKFGYGAYIPKFEYIRFPLNDFDPFKGTLSFYLKSDWTRSFLCNACNDNRDHTIARIFSGDNDTVFSLFMTGDGLKFYVTDGSNSVILTDNNQYNIVKENPTLISLVWDFENEYSFSPSFGIYINNNLSAFFEKSYLDDIGFKPSFKQSAIYNLVLGGFGWEGIISSFSSSVDGAIEDIQLFNYPINDFTYMLNNRDLKQAKKSSELIQISLDNINYYSKEDLSGLPLVNKNISPNESFEVYVKGKSLNETKMGDKNRRAHISITKVNSE